MSFDAKSLGPQGDPRDIDKELGKKIIGSVDLKVNKAQKINLGTGDSSVIVIPSPLRGHGILLRGREAFSLADGITLGGIHSGSNLEFDDPNVTPQQVTISTTRNGWQVRESSRTPTYIADLLQIKPGQKKTLLPPKKWVEVDANNRVTLDLGSKGNGNGVKGSIRKHSNGVSFQVGDRSYPLTDGTFHTIGRELRRGPGPNNNTVDISDPRISAQHGALLSYGNKLYFFDNGSSNGTQIEVIDPTGQIKPYSEFQGSVVQPIVSLASKIGATFSRPASPKPIEHAPIQQPQNNVEMPAPVHPYVGGNIVKDSQTGSRELALVLPKGGGAMVLEATGSDDPDTLLAIAQTVSTKVPSINVLYTRGSAAIDDITNTFRDIAMYSSFGLVNNQSGEISLALSQPIGDKLVFGTAGNGAVWIEDNIGNLRLIDTNFGSYTSTKIGYLNSQIKTGVINLSPEDRFIITTSNNNDVVELATMNSLERRHAFYQLAHSKQPGATPFDKSKLPNVTLSVIDLKS